RWRRTCEPWREPPCASALFTSFVHGRARRRDQRLPGYSQCVPSSGQEPVTHIVPRSFRRLHALSGGCQTRRIAAVENPPTGGRALFGGRVGSGSIREVRSRTARVSAQIGRAHV